MNQVEIRPMSLHDFNAILRLSNQLGYQIEEKDLRQQMSEILDNPEHQVFVAEVSKQIIGYIHSIRAVRLTSKTFTEIVALVVHEDFRGYGIGKKLVKEVEVLSSDLDSVRVRCNTKRNLAHQFYLKQDFHLIKEQKVFEKEL